MAIAQWMIAFLLIVTHRECVKIVWSSKCKVVPSSNVEYRSFKYQKSLISKDDPRQQKEYATTILVGQAIGLRFNHSMKKDDRQY